jgi:ATP-binding cassette subfamily F protein uup
VSVVSARNLSKAYGPKVLFSDISVTVSDGDRVALLGANGTGKSTLLRVLAGLEPTDEGVIDRRRGARIAYLAQEPVLDPDATPRQLVEQGLAEWHDASRRYAELNKAIAAGSTDIALLHEQARLAETIERLGGWRRDHVALEMLGYLGVRDIDRAVETMSGGERRRVALAQLLVSEPALAILDEPTNHLDTAAIEWLETYLAQKFAGSVLMVTHDRYLVDAVADRVLELENGLLTEYQGGYEDYLEQKAELVAHAERTEQNRLNLLRRERAWLMRGARARTTKQKARIQRADALVAAKGPKEAAALNLAGMEQGAVRMGKTILDLESMGLDLGGHKLIESLTLRLVSGDRVGIIGPNGAGKTSLLKVVNDELEPSRGTVVRGLNTRIIYFDQSRSQLRDDWSVLENVAEREGALQTGGGVVTIGDRTIEMRRYLEQFLFEGSQQRQKVGALSGGERARVALAKSLKTGANLLLLDEPTNDLDVSTLAALEELLESWPGCALLVSHDRYFLDRVATSILVFSGDGAVTRYPGGYESYRSLRAQAEAAKAQAVTALAMPARASGSADKAASAADSSLKPLTFAERKELEGILDDITALETTVADLEARLADPLLYAKDADLAKRVREDHVKAHEDLARRTKRWEELEARRDVKGNKPRA